tara:strand:- start:8092 stop:9759 length:1668 start_codon:yes stop_codon:yes gene_type:complete
MNLNARDILAKTLQAEAGNQGSVGMLSVGSVIMNRMMDPSYANNLHDVILQPGQFSVWNKTTGYAGGEQGVDVANLKASDTAYSVADQLLDQNYNDPTKGATHFYNPNISNPSWGKSGGGNWQTIGDHIFGKPQNKRKKAMVSPLNDTTLLQPNLTNNAVNNSLLSPNAGQSNAGNNKGLFGIIGNAVGGGFDKVKQAVTGEDGEASDRLALAMMSLSGNPDALRPLMEMAAQDIQDNKAQKKLDKQKNATLEFLTAKAQAGDAKAQQALELVGATGAAGAMDQYLKSTTSNTGNKTEADTTNYPNGFRVQQFQDGTIRYFLNNKEITDPETINKLRTEGQELELDFARRTKIEEGAGSAQANLLKDTMDSMINVNSSLKSFDVAKDALRRAIADNQNVTGFFTQYFPNVSLEAQELEFAATSLGLDVIGSVTFGALSKGELDLALSKEMPLGLGEVELLEYVERRESALKKYQFELRKAAKYLQNSDNTIDGYIDLLSKVEVNNEYGAKDDAGNLITSDDDLERLFLEVKSGTSMLVPEKRQMIIDEVKRRAGR